MSLYVGSTVAGLALLIAAIALLWLRRRAAHRGTPGERPPEINPDGSGRFHAVSVRFGADACATARDLHGLRFLVAESPSLPLAGCDAADCQCRIVHHRDRRSGEDRRQPFQSGFGGSATRIELDRRVSPDRRAGPRDQ